MAEVGPDTNPQAPEAAAATASPAHSASRPPATTPSMAGKHTIHGRDAVVEPLSVSTFPYAVLMGDWVIVGSSLPLWKNRSDVLCRYTPHSIPARAEQATMSASSSESVDASSKANKARSELSFSDEIWWEQLDKNGKHQAGKGAAREKRSIVRGRNRIDPKGKNDATYLWRGYNFLKPFTSHWQVLAYSDNFFDAATEEPIWLITYFTATLFTKAGIDLYVRGTLPQGAYDDIVARLKQHSGSDAASKELRALAADMFPIPTGNVKA